MAKKPPSGISLETLDFPEWKHSILKFVARLLFLKRTNYVILIHSYTEMEDDNDGRTRPTVAKPRIPSNASGRATKGSRK
jgi:hypothetical protein